MRRLVLAVAAALLLGETACADPAPAPAAKATATPAPVAAPAPPAPVVARRFGHFPYAEGTSLQDNVCRHNDPERKFLQPDAAVALMRMRAAAAVATPKVDLNPSSCFRSIASQRALFNCSGGSGTGCANGRLASAERRATAVAPPGYSEHATGYAIDFFPSAEDLKDAGACPTRNACTVTPAFARSRSGQWLAAHAHAFGFEQSFFIGSAQGVMVEPWHYRYVGTARAEAVFQPARMAFPSPKAGQRQP